MNIRYEQLVYASENKEIFEVAKTRLQQCVRFFAKNTLAQLLCMDLNFRIMDALLDVNDPANHSPRFISEINALLEEFSEMQNNPELERISQAMRETVSKLNQTI